jgi:hypothetical protein
VVGRWLQFPVVAGSGWQRLALGGICWQLLTFKVALNAKIKFFIEEAPVKNKNVAA